jgi:peptidoglycan hydrolase-like protein with peptidoglycan-binding domain
MSQIKFSVGEGGANDKQDVGIVQYLLNVVRRRNGEEPLAIDGVAGPKTLAAIKSLQKQFGKVVDGRIDPGAETITLLNQEAPHLGSNDGVSFLTHGHDDSRFS